LGPQDDGNTVVFSEEAHGYLYLRKNGVAYAKKSDEPLVSYEFTDDSPDQQEILMSSERPVYPAILDVLEKYCSREEKYAFIVGFGMFL
jgi:hypothetical protein